MEKQTPQSSLCSQLGSLGLTVCAIFSGIAIFSIDKNEFTSCIEYGSDYRHFHQTIFGAMISIIITYILCLCIGLIEMVKTEQNTTKGALLLIFSICIILLVLITFFIPIGILWHKDPDHTLFWNKAFYEWPSLLSPKCSSNQTIYRLASFSVHWFSCMALILAVSIGLAIIICGCMYIVSSTNNSEHNHYKLNKDTQQFSFTPNNGLSKDTGTL